MIQLTVPNLPLANNLFYLDLYDFYKNQPILEISSPLVIIKSQLTNYSKAITPSTNLTPVDNVYRFFEMNIVTTRSVSEQPINGIMRIGDTDFPLGFYDVSIYKNTSNDNLDPTGLTLVYTGLAFASGATAAEEPTKYNKYTNNDSDTESVYITF
jgi:hypothetical protein